MDERRHSVANPEVCGTHCHVPRYMPLLERNLSDIIDADESHPVKEGNYNDTPLSSLSPGSDIATYPVPQFTFTVDDRESYHLPDDLSLSNHEAIGLHNDNDSTPGPTSKPVLGDRCCWLAAPDSSSGIVSSRTESVCGSDLSVDSSRESDTSQHMDILKKITERLHLATRRPSYIVWKSKYIDEAPNRRLTPTDEKPHTIVVNDREEVPTISTDRDRAPSVSTDREQESSGKWTPERKTAIDDALSWLRKSLLEMREQDHALARRLVELRRDIQQVKLQRSYQEHQDILEEAIDMVDGKNELFDGLPDAFSPTLKHCGVTKMNLSTRRFSVF